MKTIINIKADSNVKIKAKKIADDLGLSLSAVINAYLKQFIRNKAVYFSAAPSIMTPELEELLGRIEPDLKKDKNISSALATAKDIKKYLSSL